MPVPYVAPMPPDVELEGSYTVRLTALDPASGNHVTGVKVTGFVLTVLNAGSGEVTDLGFGEFLLVPGPGA